MTNEIVRDGSPADLRLANRLLKLGNQKAADQRRAWAIEDSDGPGEFIRGILAKRKNHKADHVTD